MPYKKTRFYVKRRRTGLKTKRSKSLVSPTVRRYVKRVLARTIETKHVTPYCINNQQILPYYWASANCSTVINLSTPIIAMSRGTGAGQYIGNEVKVKSYTFKGYINLDSSLANETGYLKNPTFIRMIVCRKKNDDLLVSNMNDFIQLGSNYTSPQNLPSDMWRKINTDNYQILGEKRFKIGISAPSNNPADSNQWNNDFKFSGTFSFDLRKHMKTIKFDASSIPLGGAANLCCVFMMAFANGATMSSVGKPPIELHGDVEFSYEDA